MPIACDLDGLNEQQRAAVTHQGGPMLIFAGAGSGKTRVITHRIAKLVADGVPASRILAVTFTNKAAREMKERVVALVSAEHVDRMWIGTFHSICSRMLRIDGAEIGLDRNFVIYDDADQISLVKEILKNKNVDDKSMQPRAVLSEIGSAKEKLLSPSAYAEKAVGFFERIVADIYKAYDSQLHKSNALDFDDILGKTVRLLEQSQAVREKYQDRFLHVLVDEYQDVNFAQYRIVSILAQKHGNLVAVGDDDQSIYGWRGADVGLILRFGSDYPDATFVKLERNYRSTKNILAAANGVIRKNRSRADKTLWTENEAGTRVSLTQAGTERDEAMGVAEAVLRDVRSGRRKYGDFAVLYRTNAQSRVMEEAFLTVRIPHVLIGGQRFYERKEVKDMLAYLRLTLNPADDTSVRRVLNVPPRGIGPGAMAQIQQWSAVRDAPLTEALKDQAIQSGLPKKTASGIRAFVDALAHAAEVAEKGPITPVLRALLGGSGYLDMLKEDRSPDSATRLDNLQELVNVTAEYDATADEPSLGGFLESVALVADVDSMDDGADGVTLMTLHSAKGLEFPVVFIVGLEEGVFPHSRSLGSDSELEEERRLCYVGMTRARQELHLTHAHRRALYGAPNFNPRSRFIDDVPPEFIDFGDGGRSPGDELRSVVQNRSGSYVVVEPRAALIESQRQLRSPSWKPPFDVGQRVRHAKFGIGVVVACAPLRDDSEVTVAFPGVVGVKKLVQKLAKLEPV